ncbi:MAG: metalloprotease TldD, partial [Xanthomonadaceae bacterium]|nr:metalloprotease TldD [Xanthomonadaceae bacterium]
TMTSLAYAETIDRSALDQAVASAASMVRCNAAKCRLDTRAPAPVYTAEDPIVAVEVADKLACLDAIDRYVRSTEPGVSRVSARLTCSYEFVLVAATDGTLAVDARPLVELNIDVVLHARGKRVMARAGGGGRWRVGELLDRGCWSSFADEALRLARLNLDAGAAPAGIMPVVLGAGWPGILLHEAVGHGLEADGHRTGVSAYSGCLGRMVASSECCVIDDGTLPDRRGSLTIDDEGMPTARNVLVDRGRLVGLMHDKLSAREAGVSPTGNGRRESFAHPPLPRMTNTFLLPGPHAPQDIVATVDDGIYAGFFDGGQVDITSGHFSFSAAEAYRIRNGRLAEPLVGVTLQGHGPTVLQRISMVGNDLRLDPGLGSCGKQGQSLPVGVGQPTVRVDEILVGGTQAGPGLSR